MQSYSQLSAVLLALSISPVLSGRILQPRYAPNQWVELPDGEIAEWVGPASSASLNILSGTAKASVVALASTAPEAISTATGTAAASISSLIAPDKAANTPQAAQAPPPSSTPPPSPTPTPAAITHSAVPVQAVSSLLSSEANEAATLTTATAAASAVVVNNPVTTEAAVIAGGVMTIAITNNWPSPLSVSYLNNAGSPSALGAPAPAPLGTTTQVVFPTGWAGRIDIGSTTNSADSKIEGSTTGANDVDVSYVDGYSVPITCSVGGTPITGCNIDLWSVSGPCADSVGDNAVCLNPAQGIPDGPANAWFAPCQGAAYTYPNDNNANDGDTGTGMISCCIGTEAQGCAAPARQGKRDLQSTVVVRDEGNAILEEEMLVEKRNESEGVVKRHSHLGKHLQWRRARSHGLARSLKDVV